MYLGGSYGPYVRRWGDHTRTANLGQGFVAIDPKFFAPGFEDRVDDIINHIRNLEPVKQLCTLNIFFLLLFFQLQVDCEKPVLVAGDPERQHMEFVDKTGGIQYIKDQLDSCAKLSKLLQVTDLEPLKK